MKRIDEKKRFVLILPIAIIVLLLFMFITKMGMPLILKLISPMSHISRENFNAVEVYIGMLSIAFIVTSMVTVLSDKTNTIYWTTVVEYQLVNPRFISLREMVTYLAVIAACGFISLFVFPEFIFVCLLLTIVCLFLITYRMIDGFINRKKILKRLKEDFVFYTLKNYCFSICNKSSDAKEAKNEIVQKLRDNIDNYDINELEDCSYKNWVAEIRALLKTMIIDKDNNISLKETVLKRMKGDKELRNLYNYIYNKTKDKPKYQENAYVVLKNSLVGNLMKHIEDNDLYRVAEDIDLMYWAEEDWKTPIKMIIQIKPYLYYQLSKVLSFASFFEFSRNDYSFMKETDCIELASLFKGSCDNDKYNYLLELVYRDCYNESVIYSDLKEKHVKIMKELENNSPLTGEIINKIKSYGDDRLEDRLPPSLSNRDI